MRLRPDLVGFSSDSVFFKAWEWLYAEGRVSFLWLEL